ncbi:MAG: hypothetical protein JXB32_20680, partial [Deltaproteobacteria bacterium]|nr:hypothetical protein [Deltaproteobacteria bacterium]
EEAAADDAAEDEAAAAPEAAPGDVVGAAPDVAALPPTEVVAVRIAARPVEAEIRIDGVKVRNPYEGRFRKGDPDLKVEVTARGHETEVRLVSLSEDAQLEVQLERRTATPRRDAGGVAPAEAGAPPPPPPPPPADSGRPGIDENNPFTRRDAGSGAIDRSRPFS